MNDQPIVSAKIHPAIGIARVGNSLAEDGYFIGPETTVLPTQQDQTHRDETGALLRQAARFRIYGYDASGQPVRELTAEEADIEWSVTVANKKAAWYSFNTALDIPQATPARRRNANFVGDARQQLAITPSPITIGGCGTQGDAFRFDDGQFLEQSVCLGELRTDEFGRLLFLGGLGKSGTPFANNPATTFANNEGWYDDTSDGPVHASVTLNERSLPVESAWVATAPPNYAPDVISVITMYDLIFDASQFYWLSAPKTPSFHHHLLPLFQQFSMAQWVNKGFQVQFGFGAPYDFNNPELLAKLAQGDDEYQELRRQVFRMFRDPAGDAIDANSWPWMYGDGMNIPAKTPNAFLAITKTQYTWLQAWVDGNFVADYGQIASPPFNLEEMAVALQPGMLDKAALWYCLGGPFHPGCELTWPMRHPTMYTAAFRVRERDALDPEPDFGEFLDPKLIQSGDEYGPLFANSAGDLTRWMAVPWQTDTASCKSGYDSAYDPYIPTFWPARVPNHVLTEDDYATVINSNVPDAERIAAYNRREVWTRGLGSPESYVQQINTMVDQFDRLGVVEQRPGVSDLDPLPSVMFVETGLPQTKAAPASTKSKSHLRAVNARAIAKTRQISKALGED